MSIICKKSYTITGGLPTPMFYYKLDGLVAAKLHDEGPNGWELGFLFGAATFPAGIIVNGMAGTGDYRKIDNTHDLLPIGTSFTVRFWMKLETGVGADGGHILLAGNSGSFTGLYVDMLGVEGVDKNLHFYLSDTGSVVADVTVPFDFDLTYDAWHHFIFTYEVGVGIAVRVDDAHLYSLSYSTALSDGVTTFIEILGQSSKAVMDEVGMWDTAWTAVQITADYNGGAGLTYP